MKRHTVVERFGESPNDQQARQVAEPGLEHRLWDCGLLTMMLHSLPKAKGKSKECDSMEVKGEEMF